MLINDQSSSAVRLSWYALTHTLAVTYYDGFNHSYPVFRQKYSEVSDGYFYQTEYGYYPKKGVGFELSVPFGQLNFKFDGTISDFFHIRIKASRIRQMPSTLSELTGNSEPRTMTICKQFQTGTN